MADLLLWKPCSKINLYYLESRVIMSVIKSSLILFNFIYVYVCMIRARKRIYIVIRN